MWRLAVPSSLREVLPPVGAFPRMQRETGEAMDLVNGLNAISSQVWAVVLILLGIAAFGMACTCNAPDVRSALMSSGTGMIGGGIAMFQHQEKGQEKQP